MKMILLALLFSVGMACTAQGQGLVKDHNDQLSFNGFGWYRVDNNTMEALYGMTNYTESDLVVTIQIKELGFENTVVVPAYSSEVYSLGYNVLTNKYEELPQLHVIISCNQPNNDFVLRFTYWGRMLHKLQNKPLK